ncbi:uncharacterized protein LOC144100178 [Amblyomma americanum]
MSMETTATGCQEQDPVVLDVVPPPKAAGNRAASPEKKRHMRVPTGEKPYACPRCKKVLKCSKHKRRHFATKRCIGMAARTATRQAPTIVHLEVTATECDSEKVEGSGTKSGYIKRVGDATLEMQPPETMSPRIEYLGMQSLEIESIELESVE